MSSQDPLYPRDSTPPTFETNVDAPQPLQRPDRPPRLDASPDSRMDTWRNLLTDFVWSLGSGMSARAKGKKGAGIGEALTGPWALEELKVKQQLEKQRNELMIAQEERSRVASQEAMAKIAQAQAELPLKLQQIMSQVSMNQARVPEIQSQTAMNTAKVPQIQAETANTLNDAAQKTMLKVGDRVFRMSDLLAPDASNVQPLVSGEDVNITITPQIAEQIGNPNLAGQVVSAKVGKELTGMVSSSTKFTPTANGVIQQNLITGTRENLGPPPGVAYAQARPVDVIGPNGLPMVTSAANAIATGATPGRLSDVQKITGQAASFSNFHSNVNEVRRLLPAINQSGATTRIAAAMAQPEGALRQWLQGQLATGNLNSNEYDLINALATLREDIFNLRTFFGNAPVRSDRQVSLMMAQLPDIRDLATGNSQQVEAKLNNLLRSVASVEGKFGPLMSLVNNPQFKASPAAGPGPTTGTGGGADYIMQGGRLVPNPAKSQGR